MIQKKVCMVGVYGTGKTSLVQRYVHSLFSAKYHSTVGVKIDRKHVQLGDTAVNLLLWDVEGRTADQDIPASYLRGAHAVFYVADGTRRDTFDQLFDLREHSTLGGRRRAVDRRAEQGRSEGTVAVRRRADTREADLRWLSRVDDEREDRRRRRRRVSLDRDGDTERATVTRQSSRRCVMETETTPARDARRRVRPFARREGAQRKRGSFRDHDAAEVRAASRRRICRTRRSSTGCAEPEVSILVVADGVGGAVGGKIASGIAVQSVVEYLAEAVGCVQDFDVDREQTFLDHLSRGVERGHERLKEMFQTQGGPATTLTMVTLLWPRAYVVHVGDSRGYYLRHGKLKQFTRDQTMGDYLVDIGAVTEQHAQKAGLYNVLSSAVGGDLVPSVGVVDLAEGDALLLCTDGLTKHVSDERIAEVLSSAPRSRPLRRSSTPRSTAAGPTT